jgi:serine/threonine protein kinase
MDHPNVVKLYEIFDDDDCMYLVMELMSGGEVSSVSKCVNIKVELIYKNSYLIVLWRKSIILRKKQLIQLGLLLMQLGIAIAWG